MVIFSVLFIGLAFPAILGLTINKVIKSKLPDLDKLYRGIVIVLFQIVASIVFINAVIIF
jgi:hypothetical protein